MNNLGVIAGVMSLVVFCSCGSDRTEVELGADRLLAHSAEYAERGAFSLAVDSAEAALAILEGLHREARMADVEKMLGGYAIANADYEHGVQYLERAYTHYRGQAAHTGSLAVLLMLSEVYTDMRDEAHAFDLLNDAWQVAELVHDSEAEQTLGAALVVHARALSKSETVRQVKERLRQLSQSSDLPRVQSWLLDDDGDEALTEGHALVADSLFQHEAEIALHSNDTVATASSLGRSASAMSMSGKPAVALDHFTRALTLLDGHPVRLEQREQLWFEMGLTAAAAGRMPDAVRCFESAATSAEQRQAPLYQSLATVMLAWCALPVDPGKAAGLVDLAASLLGEIHPPALGACIDGLRGRARLGMNQPNEALDAFRHAMAESESAQASSRTRDILQQCLETVSGPGETPWHDEAVDLLLRFGRTEDAFRVALRRQSVSRVRTMEFLSIPTSGDPKFNVRQTLRTIRGQLAASEVALCRSLSSPIGRIEQTGSIVRRREAIRERERAMLGELLSASPGLKADYEVLSADTSAGLLRVHQDTAMVLFASTARAVQEFVLTKAGISVSNVRIEQGRLVALCGRFGERLSLLNATADSTVGVNANGHDKALSTELDSLYDFFVRPIERSLAGVGNVALIYPDGIPFVPIHAIRRSGSKGTSLVEKAQVWYQSSMRTIPRESTGSMKDIVTIGSPGTSGRDVEYELRDVKAYFKDARLYFMEAAQPGLFVRERGDLVHLGLEITWDAWVPALARVSMADSQARATHEYPVLQLGTIQGFRSAMLYNFSRFPEIATSNIATVLMSGGMQDVILNGLYSGRKSNKVFSEAVFSALQSGVSFSAAYRTAVLAEAQGKDGRLEFWMVWALFRRAEG